MSLPQKYITGLVVSWASVSTVTIGTGFCRDSGNLKNIRVGSALTVDITTSGANGIDTGAEASNTWYYVWVIAQASGANPRGLLSTSSTAPTMPTGYSVKRLVGAVKNNAGSDFADFTTFGTGTVRRYCWNTLLTNRRVLAGGTDAAMTDVDCSAYVPAGFAPCFAYLAVGANTNTAQVYLRPNGVSVGSTARAILAADTNQHLTMQLDSSAVFEYQRNAGTGTIDIDVEGFDFNL